MSNPIEQAVHQMPETQKQKSFWQNVFVGSLSGISAVSIIQPMIHFKNVSQTENFSPVSSRRIFQINPRVWYRGVGGFAMSFAPTVAIQTAANGIFSQKLNPLAASCMAGITSAIIVCPAEGIMIQQQKSGKSFYGAIKYIHSLAGFRGFFRALAPTAVREGAFTAAYLGATPLLKRKLQSFQINEWAAQMIAGTVAGTAACIISHPFDTYKTQKQGDFSLNESMFKKINQTNAFAGFKWRVAMIVTATIVIPYVQEKASRVF